MKNITSAVLGLTLTLATAGLTFAQTAPAPVATDSAAPVAKKHVKKVKKVAKSTAAPTAVTAAAPAPAPAK